MRTSLGAAVVLCLSLAASSDARAGDARAVAGEFFQKVTVRHGVASDSLVVLPIVLEGDAAAGEGPSLGTGIDWRRVEGSTSLVEMRSAADDTPRERLLASGTLLTGGEQERLLSRPVPLLDGEHAVAASIVCDSRKAPVKVVGAQLTGPVAPLEQRKLLAIGCADRLFPILQQIQACLVGAPPGTETVAAVLEAPKLQGGAGLRLAVLQPLLKAYGGTAVGHVAFFGFRPVEAIAFARPADYQACGPAYLKALAQSHFLWREVNGASALPAKDEDVRRLVAEGASILKAFARMHGHEVRPAAGERCRWSLFDGVASSDSRSNRRTETFACRFALDGTGRFAQFEAVENGPETIYPQPYREPGGRPVGEPPDNKSGGGMTIEALERLLQRMIERREARARAQQGR